MSALAGDEKKHNGRSLIPIPRVLTLYSVEYDVLGSQGSVLSSK